MLKLKKVRNGWIIFNDSGGYDKHSHFSNKKSAECCLALLKKGIMPEQPYFKESAKRLLSCKEYNNLSLKRNKDKYINVNNGVKR